MISERLFIKLISVGCTAIFLNLICFSNANLIANEALLDDFGPENDGLRMSLSILNPVNGADSHMIKVELLNTGEKIKVLSANWLYERDTGKCIDYIRSIVSFTSYPPVEDGTILWGMSMGTRISPQPFLKLNPGEKIKIEWQTENNRLKTQEYVPPHNPIFHMAGLYEVYAELKITVDTKNILLRSNEQPFIVGGSHKLPKHTIAYVSALKPDQKLVTLNLGSLHQIQKGDEFNISANKAYGFHLKIIDVWDDEFSNATVETRTNESGKAFMNAFPQIGQMAVLVIGGRPK